MEDALIKCLNDFSSAVDDLQRARDNEMLGNMSKYDVYVVEVARLLQEMAGLESEFIAPLYLKIAQQIIEDKDRRFSTLMFSVGVTYCGA